MRKLLIGLVAVVVLLIGGLFALPLLIPSETVKAELIAQIEAATGRDVRIDGPVSISVLPSASLSAEGIGLGETGDTEALSLDSVSFGLDLFPLIGGRVEINGITIERPRIVFAVDENGGTNWTGDVEPAPAPTDDPDSIEALIEQNQPAPSDPAAPAADALDALRNLTVSRIAVVDGTLVYRDLANGTDQVVEALNLEISMPDMIGAGTIEGTFTLNGQEQTIALTVGDRPAENLLERIPVDFRLSSPGGSLAAKGTALGEEALFAGTVATEGSSLRDFARPFGVDLPDAPGFADFSLSGPFVVDDTSVLVESFEGEIGGTTISGGTRLVYDRVRPGIGLKLAAGRIDAALFTAPDAAGGEAGRDGNDDSVVAGGGGNGGGADGDQVIDFAALGSFDANVDFTASEVALGEAGLANLGVDLQIVGGLLTATIRSVEINGAPGTANLTVDGRETVPVISGAARMNGLDVAGLMALVGMSAPVSGTGGLDVSFRTSGASLAALTSGIEANGIVTLADGAVGELDLADLVGGDPAADRVEDIDITAKFSSLDAPVSVDGALSWRGERFSVAAQADARALFEGEEAEVSLNTTAKRLNFGFAGVASLEGLGTGKVSLSTPSLRNLLAWIGQPIDPGGGLEAFSIDGIVALESDRFTFDRTAFTLDGSSGLGTGSIVFADKPKVTAGLAMTLLDITPYLAASGATNEGGRGNGGRSGGASAGGGGSDAVDFSGLSAIDADLNLQADNIIADDIKIGPSALTVKVAGGRLDANLAEMALYSGAGKGTLSIDGAAETPTASVSFKLTDVSAQPFLTDTLGVERIAGVGDFAFDLKTFGRSQYALMESLAGWAVMDVRDGAILGIDIPKMLKNLSLESLLGWQPGNDKTEFSQIDATFTVTNGIATNDDLVMAGPKFALNGAGRIDLPRQTVSYVVNAKVAGKKNQLEDFAVPIRIEGDLDSPKFYPDVQGVLENPTGAIDQIRSVGSDLLGQATGNKKKDKKKGKNKKKKADKNSPADQILDLLQTQ